MSGRSKKKGSLLVVLTRDQIGNGLRAEVREAEMKLVVALTSAATISAGGLVLSASGAEAWSPYGQRGSASPCARAPYAGQLCTPCSAGFHICGYYGPGCKLIKERVRCTGSLFKVPVPF